MKNHLLSKSTFIRSVQCLKSLYLYKNFYHLKDPIPKERQAVFNRGIHVGELARDLFPGGIDVSPENPYKYSESVQKTADLIAAGDTIIYEACFIYDHVLVAIDILVKKDNKWFAYEVKSSAKISATYVMDACLQYHVIKNSLPGLEDIFIVNINSNYVFDGVLDLHALFKFTSVKEDAEKNSPFITDRIQKAKLTVGEAILPEVAVGTHCFAPYECDYLGTCWKNIPKESVFELTNISKAKQSEWYLAGYKKITDLPESIDATENVKRQIEAVKSGNEVVQKDKLNEFIKGLKFPLALMDVEVIMPAIPFYIGTHPFQQLPFLFSAHVQKSADEIPVHRTWIADHDVDPRRQFAEQIISALKDCETVLVFADQMERSALNKLASHFPDLSAELKSILSKMQDLALPFQHSWYYHPKMKGSLSLKNIFPALCDDTSFDQLSVNSGVQAMYAFQELKTETNMFKVNEVKEQLTNYCKTDTFSMYKILEVLKSKIE